MPHDTLILVAQVPFPSTRPVTFTPNQYSMYVGDPRDGSGLHMLLWHALEDPLSEHLAGHVHHIKVVLEKSGHVSVRDDGHGYPVDSVEGTPRLVRTLTTLEEPPAEDPGRIRQDWTGGPGLVCINALSVETTVEVFSEGGHHRVRCSRGVAGELEHLGPTTDHGALPLCQRLVRQRPLEI